MSNRMGLYLHNSAGWRLVCLGGVGNDGGDAYTSSGVGYNIGRLVGVSDGVASSKNLAQPKIIAPSLEQILAVVNNPDLNREGMAKTLTAIYQR